MVRIVLYRLLEFYLYLILAHCILSWIPSRGGILDDIRAVLDRAVEPYLSQFRRLIPPMGGVDFSPILAMVCVELVQRLVLYVIPF